ncbi:MAG TPA: type II secretion system protein N [Candidatus Hydrogenedentes bacterium]|nr:type II secretion system protein N [Candidatus Hydrogenedentota bacterium]
MLRGLAIRRAFVAGERLLALGVILGVAAWYGDLLRYLPRGKPSVAAAIPVEPDSAAGSLALPKARTEYDGLVASGLFGPAAAAVQEAPPPPPEPDEKDTELRLQLCGTAATSPKDLFATALILNQDSGKVGAFFVGQQVVENVTLEEIHPKKVILFNKNANRREVLRAETADTRQTQMASRAPKPSAPPPPPPGPGNRINLNKTELIQEVVTNYADLVTQVRPELYRDESGNIAGITANNIESVPLAKTLDVRNGDILQTVNNEPIDSQEKIMEIINKYRNSNTFRIGILRDGKPMVITYKLD